MNLRIGLIVPHIFMQQVLLPHVIFSPGHLALSLAEGLQSSGVDVTLFSPGPTDSPVRNITADLGLFEKELEVRGDSYLDLLKKHPFTFITLARQVQSELLAKAYLMANQGEFDVLHVYTNEEDIALPFAQFCRVPVVFTHHDPFNFQVKYKSVFPKYKHLPWISMSYAQRQGMPADTNWLANIYHGVNAASYKPMYRPQGRYVAYLGRVIESKGVHLAIAAVQSYNHKHKDDPMQLRIAGKHYANKKDAYWQDKIEPQLDGKSIIYDGFVDDVQTKNEFLGNAQGVLMPSLFDEPFGMVSIESLASGTPVIALDSGALPEIVRDGKTGFVIHRAEDENVTAMKLANALEQVSSLQREGCREDFEERFTLQRMAKDHISAYRQVIAKAKE